MKRATAGLFILLAMGLSGCASVTPKFPSLRPPEQPRTIYNWNEEVISEPKVIKSADGQVIVQRTEKRVSAGLDTTPKKVTLSERIGGFISGLSFWILVLIILGIILAPATTIGFLFNKYRQYRDAMTQTVAAIKEARAVESQALHDALKSKQTTETKKIVGTIKSEL